MHSRNAKFGDAWEGSRHLVMVKRSTKSWARNAARQRLFAGCSLSITIETTGTSYTRTVKTLRRHR